MLTTIRYVLLTALRDRVFAGLFIALIVLYGISAFLGSTALFEKLQMTTVTFAGLARLTSVIGMIVFVCFHVRRAFDNREIDVMVSRPISRSMFVFSYWLGFVLVSMILVLPLTGSLFLLLPINVEGGLLWSATLFCELSVMAAFSVFSSLILTSATSSVLLCFGFYFMARLMGFFLYMLEKDYLLGHYDFGRISEVILVIASFITPRFDIYAQSEWLIYGIGSASLSLYPIQMALYVPFLLLVAMFDFKRRQF